MKSSSYIDLNNLEKIDMTAKRWEKPEYLEQPEKPVINIRPPRMLYSSEVMERIKKQPKSKPSTLLQEHMEILLNGMPNSIDSDNLVSTPRVLSEIATKARNEIFKKLGINR